MGGGAARAWAFYNYGRKHFNRKGWINRQEWFKSQGIGEVDLQGKVYLCTGANSGIGKSLTNYLFSRGARVYMVCRNEERAKKAREEIVEANGESKADELRIIVADVSVRADVEKCVEELGNKWAESVLDGLICNAGALLDKKVLTKDNVETTFACHFLFGTYWLGKLAVPFLQKSADPRIVIVTSGGMYNSKLHNFGSLVEGGTEKSFDGQIAYAKAKRAQVVCAERWAKEMPSIKIVSAHPGWTLTPGVQNVYGTIGQWLLSPLRSEWEGTEGIAWLCGTSGKNIESGKLYLDGEPQPLHLHKSTKVPVEEEDAFFKSVAEFIETPKQDATKI